MKMKSCVTISLVPEARGGPFVFWDDLAAACKTAADIGFDAVEIFPPGSYAVDARTLRVLLDDHHLKLAAVGTGAGWVKHRLHLALPDAADRQKARSFIRSIIDVAGAFGAPAIIGSMQGRSEGDVDAPTAFAYLAEAAAELAEHARQYGVPLLFEPLNRYETNQVTSIEAGLRLIEASGSTNVALLADLFHMNIEEVDVAKSILLGGSKVGHVHFVDSNRRAAGLGHTDFAPIVAALRSIGYSRYLSAEALPLPDPEAAARQTIEAFRAVQP